MKISGSGLTYKDLQNVYSKHGRNGLVAILLKPPSQFYRQTSQE